MRKFLNTKLLLLISFFAFISCSKDEVASPDFKSPQSLIATKWDWISWGTTTGEEIALDPQNPVYIHFLDDSNIERITKDENGQASVTKLTYQISKDTLIAYEMKEANYFMLKEHTDTKLTLSRVKHVDLDTKEVTATPSGIFKYSKVRE